MREKEREKEIERKCVFVRARVLWARLGGRRGTGTNCGSGLPSGEARRGKGRLPKNVPISLFITSSIQEKRTEC